MIVIQQADINGDQVVYEIQQQSFTNHWSLKDWQDLLKVPGTIVRLAYDKQKPIGYAVIRHCDDMADVISVAVLPSYRQQGIGKALMKELMKEMQDFGVRKILLEVGCNNIAAQHLYQILGFKPIFMRPNYYYNPPSPPENAIVMQYFCHI
ncbi:MAG: ribosomal protein S18-alanine N-acetyltransferase [Alphaproteobacteria bacterium]|nr:ribosomal protein S18-alanine N-acetyltransferase [Alphaproteobacteria bacterium]